MATSIVVGIRVRPFNQREMKFDSKLIVSMQGNQCELAVVRQGKICEKEQPKKFNYDHCFWTHDQGDDHVFAGQDIVYQHMGHATLENVLNGYNACVFAYGQTGSGKTYSMMGTPSDPGLIPRICQNLYGAIAERSATHVFSVECSYLEIYNENVRDLLNPKDSGMNLKIRQHPKFGVFVEGLTKIEAKTQEEVLALLEDGLKVRTVAATLMNATSSRSHAILTLSVSQKDKDGSKLSRLSLVDLAGSERASSTGATGDTLVEGSNINKSLSTLGMCLSRLAESAESGKNAGHVPFRDSSLTFLLMDNLGGNSRTSMMANISPADINFDETLSTLRFAATAKKIKNQAIVNEDPNVRLIRELREELSQLQEKLRKYKEGETPAELQDEISNSTALMKELDVDDDERKRRQVEVKQERHEAMAVITAQGIFVDWKFPQLMTVHQDFTSIANLAIVYHVREGDNLIGSGAMCSVKLPPMDGVSGHHATIQYNALSNQTSLITIPGIPVYVNGNGVQEELPLLHGDLIEIGPITFRLAHASSQPESDDFKRKAVSPAQTIKLEIHQRLEIQYQETGARNALYEAIATDVQKVAGSESIEAVTLAGVCIEAADDVETFKFKIHESEVRLAADPDFTVADEGLNFEIKTKGDFALQCEEHLELLEELRAMDADAVSRQDYIRQLEMELAELCDLTSPTASMSFHVDPLAPDEELDLMKKEEQIFEKWESAVISAQKFSVSGPQDPDDQVTWKNLEGEGAPFLNTLLEGSPLTGKLYKLGQNKFGGWAERYAVINKRFLYYFKKNYGGEKPAGGIYLYGCKVDLIRGLYHGRSNAMRVTAAAPRREGDTDATGHIFLMAFDTPEEAHFWKAEIEKVALPPMPKLKLRKVLQDAKGELLPKPKADIGKGHWKADEEQDACEECSARFTTFLRRHHCRTCGGIFCDSCCPKATDGHRKCKRCQRIEAERSVAKEATAVTRRMTIKPSDEHSQVTADDALSMVAVNVTETIATRWKLPLTTIPGSQYLKCFFEAKKNNSLCFIGIDHFMKTVTLYSATKVVNKVYPSPHVLSLQKSPTDSTKVTVLFVGKNQIHDFVFKDAFQRERFCETLSAMRPQLRVHCPDLTKDDVDVENVTTLIDALGPNSSTIKDDVMGSSIELSGECKINASKSLQESVVVWIGSWNAKNSKEAFPDVLKRLVHKPTSSIHVLNVQFLPHAKHESFFEAVTEYFGKEYIPCVTMVQFQMATIALIRRRQVLKSHNVEATLGNGAYKTMVRVMYPQGEKGGVAVCVRVLETSFCFINLELPEDASQRAQCTHDTLTRMQLGYDCVEITEQFDNVFVAAAANTGFAQMKNLLSGFTPSVEATGNFVACRGDEVKVLDSNSGSNCLSALFTVPIVRTHAQCFSSDPPKFVIRILEMVASFPGSTEPIVKGIVHISNNMSCPQRTTGEEAGTDVICWRTTEYPILLAPPTTYVPFTATRSVYFTVRDVSQTQESRISRGSGTLAMKQFLADGVVPFNVPQNAKIPLRHGGVEKGFLEVSFQFCEK